MTDLNTTKIPFISPVKMVEMIATIEVNFPGWWWSISQKLNSLKLSLGPTLYSGITLDRKWAMTEDGDSGVIVSFETENDDRDNLISFAYSKAMEEIESRRPAANILPFIEQKSGMRIQSADDLSEFTVAYTKLISLYDKTLELGTSINEVLIGSCHLSVDVSLRGMFEDGQEFDISNDLQGDAILADSISGALEDLCDAVEGLTDKESEGDSDWRGFHVDRDNGSGHSFSIRADTSEPLYHAAYTTSLSSPYERGYVGTIMIPVRLTLIANSDDRQIFYYRQLYVDPDHALVRDIMFWKKLPEKRISADPLEYVDRILGRKYMMVIRLLTKEQADLENDANEFIKEQANRPKKTLWGKIGSYFTFNPE